MKKQDINVNGDSFRKGWELAEEISDRIDVDLDLNTLEAKTGSLALILHDILVELEEMGANAELPMSMEGELNIITRFASKVATEKVDAYKGRDKWKPPT